MPRTCALFIAALLVSACSGGTPTATGSPTPDAGTTPTASATTPATPGGIAPPSAAPSTAASKPAAAATCGSTSDHVYHLYRLHLLDPCRTVTGVVAGVRSEKDGDYHVRLALDPQFASMLRPANNSFQGGDLVLEPICQHDVTQADAVGPCSGGVPHITIPPIGTHVSATGAYVLDEQHNGWAELHPLFEIHPG